MYKYLSLYIYICIHFIGDMCIDIHYSCTHTIIAVTSDFRLRLISISFLLFIYIYTYKLYIFVILTPATNSLDFRIAGSCPLA